MNRAGEVAQKLKAFDAPAGRGPEFDAQYPYRSSQSSGIPAPGIQHFYALIGYFHDCGKWRAGGGGGCACVHILHKRIKERSMQSTRYVTAC